MINEEKLLTDAERINKIKAANKSVAAKKAAKLLARKRELEYEKDLESLMGYL